MSSGLLCYEPVENDARSNQRIWGLSEFRYRTDFHNSNSFEQNISASEGAGLVCTSANDGGSAFVLIATRLSALSLESWIDRRFDLGIVISSCLITAAAECS